MTVVRIFRYGDICVYGLVENVVRQLIHMDEFLLSGSGIYDLSSHCDDADPPDLPGLPSIIRCNPTMYGISRISLATYKSEGLETQKMDFMR